MGELVAINNHRLTVREFRGQRVITFKEIDEAHEIKSGYSRKNFYNNRGKFIEGVDYFKITTQEALSVNFTLSHIPNGLVLITKSGYLMLVKSLTDDLSWKVQRQLVDFYFQEAVPVPAPRPMSELQILRAAIDQIEVAQQTASQALSLAESNTETIQNIKETLTPIDKEWRRWANKQLQKIGFKTGDYQAARNKSYEMLEARAFCSLERRLNNLKKRMINAAATKTQIANANYMDVIEVEPRLKEIYSAIIKELSIKYVA